jgi:hypothetical protein
MESLESVRGNEDVDLQCRRWYQGKTMANNGSTPLYVSYTRVTLVYHDRMQVSELTIFTDKPYEAYSSGEE